MSQPLKGYVLNWTSDIDILRPICSSDLTYLDEIKISLKVKRAKECNSYDINYDIDTKGYRSDEISI